MLDHDEVVRLYGPWAARTPLDAKALLADYGGRWWIAGGWAIDAFAGDHREHGDLDVGIPRDTAGAFIRFMSHRLDVWAASGSLTPLVGEEARIPDTCGNLWLRASGAAPWEYDVLLESAHEQTWTFKRDRRISRPLAECVWYRDGIAYVRPEVQLLLKAKNARAKDTVDLERCLPRLDADDVRWLDDALALAHPESAWRERIAAFR